MIFHYEVWEYVHISSTYASRKVNNVQTLEEAKACFDKLREKLAPKDSRLAGSVLAVGIDEISTSGTKRIMEDSR